jgi:HlyD family secretion protein
MKTKHLLFVSLVGVLCSCGGKKEANSTAAENEPLTSTEVPLDSTMKVKEVVGIARIEPEGKIIGINAETAGFVKEVLFAENTRVKKGDVLVVLESSIENAQLHQAQSRIKTQQASITATKANLESLKVKLANAQNTFERNLKLLQGNAATQQSVDDSRFNVEDLQKQLAAQQANIQQQEARLEELRADIGLSQTQLGKKSLRAPLAGTFLSCDVKPGNYIAPKRSWANLPKRVPTWPLVKLTNCLRSGSKMATKLTSAHKEKAIFWHAVPWCLQEPTSSKSRCFLIGPTTWKIAGYARSTYASTTIAKCSSVAG